MRYGRCAHGCEGAVVECSHQGCVDGKLHTAPQWQAIGDDLKTTVMVGSNNIEVAEQDVDGNSCTCFTADSGGRPLDGDAPGAQKSSAGAGGAVVAIQVQGPGAPGSGTWPSRKGAAGGGEHQYPERRRVQAELRAGWASCERCSFREQRRSQAQSIPKRCLLASSIFCHGFLGNSVQSCLVAGSWFFCSGVKAAMAQNLPTQRWNVLTKGGARCVPTPKYPPSASELVALSHRWRNETNMYTETIKKHPLHNWKAYA